MIRTIISGALLAVTLGLAPTPSAAAQTSDEGVLFWPPARREAAFRDMAQLTPHRRVPHGAVVRPLPAGALLDLDVSAYMEAERTAGVLVIQDGRVRLEHYGLGMTAADPWVSFSMTKSLTSTLVGAALRDGLIHDLDDPITRYLPEMAGGGYDGVTVRQLLTMTSGVAWNEDYDDPNSDVARFLTTPADPGLDATVSYMRRLSRAEAPGTHWRYSTGETNLVGVLLGRATGRPLSDYLAEKIWAPAGMEADGQWMLDAQGKEIGGCCVSATLRDWGRVGLMALDGGVTGGTTIVGPDWFARATSEQADIGEPGMGYGYQWWTYDDGRYGARGIFGQAIQIDPARKLVIVVLSAWPEATGEAHSAARTALFDLITAAVDAEPH